MRNFIIPIVSGFAVALSLTLGVSAEPVRVELRSSDDGSQLFRDAKPYLIRGGGGSSSLKELKAAGGNSIRTWGAEHLDKTLDEAQSLGLTVTVGIWLGHARHGFDYTNAKQVEDQFEMARKAILQYKDHPAVLMWGIGNEMESMGSEENAAIWSHVNGVAAMAHRLDPNHPTMTVVAEIGGKKITHIHRLCPEIDIVGINSYAGASTLPKRYKAAGGTKPYLLTEFGPPGIWESGKTAYGVALELTSTQKALCYSKAWRAAVIDAKGVSLGGYAFVWGHKQEATATWFGTFLPDGARLGAIDALTEAWTGTPAVNLCPNILRLALEGADDVEPGTSVHAVLSTADPENDPLQVTWVLQGENASQGVGGDAEAAPPTFPEAVTRGDANGADVTMPKDGGSYRLFAFVHDDHGGAAVANVPLHVKGPVTLPKAKAATLPLVVYDEAGGIQPFVPAGWMGNAKAIQVDPKCETRPHAGKTCVRCDFTENQGWGGVVWQSPEGDWGDRAGGFDLTGAKTLSFWARGEKGGETVTFLFGLFPKSKRFFDTGSGKLDRVKLTGEWAEYRIEVTGKDLTRIKSGFAWTTAAEGSPVTFYLDDVRWE